MIWGIEIQQFRLGASVRPKLEWYDCISWTHAVNILAPKFCTYCSLFSVDLEMYYWTKSW